MRSTSLAEVIITITI